MSNNPYIQQVPSVYKNTLLRIPQHQVFKILEDLNPNEEPEREFGIVIPVGCGKSGCITLSPFAFKANRTLVVAPGVRIAGQLHEDFDPTHPNFFYKKCCILDQPPYPEPVEIRGTSANLGDLEEAHVVITNIQQLQGQNNRWLSELPTDFFDLIQFDEGHHSVAETWQMLKNHFPNATIINFSATPLRADGQKMSGRILYSYPVSDAIRNGYVKRLKAVVLNPRTLKYIRNEDGVEVEVDLEEVRRLGEQEADFRRSIITSEESLKTIIDASIRELQRIRKETGENRHKIIASVLNFKHCNQVVQAYRSRGLRADYIHSREDSSANAQVMRRLENHEIDVIVQVKKLGEGFDHPFLSVAAVISIYANLSPFVQFVGRIMRVIDQVDTNSLNNQGVVVFHAGTNIAQRWEDFQEFSTADKEFFNALLPMEGLDFADGTEIEIDPIARMSQQSIQVSDQSLVDIQEIPLIVQDEEAMQAINTLRNRGYTPDQVKNAMVLEPVVTTKIKERQGARTSLDMRIRTTVGKILATKKLNGMGHDLDRKRLNKTNFIILKSAIDKAVNKYIGRGTGERHEFTRSELDSIESNYENIIKIVLQEVFNAAA